MTLILLHAGGANPRSRSRPRSASKGSASKGDDDKEESRKKHKNDPAAAALTGFTQVCAYTFTLLTLSRPPWVNMPCQKKNEFRATG